MYDDFRVIVPQAARSAATLIATAADEVVMGKHSSLGPIDPQLELHTELGPRLVPAHAILNQFDEARTEYQKSGDIAHWGPILRQYGPSLLTECEDAINYSEELALQWAHNYMFASEDEERAQQLAAHLSRRAEHKSHNRPIMRSEARDIGFQIRDLEEPQEFQDAVLSVFHAATITHNATPISKIIQNNNGNSFVVFAGSPEEEEPDDGESD